MNIHKRLLISIVLFFFASTTQTALSAIRVNCFDPRWPSERSELQPDPSLKRGRLENGFRYVIKQNREPENRVAVFLNVQAGSLNEDDNQRGLAHFLEHMMFNGSTNFPPGSLIEYFQSIGMNFGGDINAHTSYDETVYHIILPGGTAEDLDDGLRVLRDYARGALLLDEEIERERAVILAEKRARNSAGYRVHVAESDFAFRGTLYPLRRPIGEKQVIERADHQLLRSYYDAWYRPDNMIVVLVGDTEPELAARLIEKHFAGLDGAGPQPQCPDFGALTNRGVEVYYASEPELGKVNISLETFWQLETENDSIDLQKRKLLEHMGSMIMRYRLDRILERNNLPFSYGRYQAGDIIQRIGFGALAAQTDKGGWRASLMLLEQTLRQALQFGFAEDEIERAKKEITAGLESRVVTESSQNSRQIARSIIHHLNRNRVYRSPEQEQRLYVPLISQVGADDVNSAFRQLWNHSFRFISVTGDIELHGQSAELIREAYRDSLAVEVHPPKKNERNLFPYLPLPASTSQPRKIVREDVGIETLVYPNGLVVNLKKTDYENDRFLLAANFGNGALDEPSQGMAMVAERVINGSGSGRLNKSAVEGIVAGSSVDISFRAGKSAFSWTGSGLVKDFELFTQLLYTFLYDPGVRGNVFTRVMSNYELMYQKMEREIEGADALFIQPFLAAYNTHFGLPPWDTLKNIQFKDLQGYVHSDIRPKDLEISVVGDIEPEHIGALLTKYFSSITLDGLEKTSSGPLQFPAGRRLKVEVDTTMDKALIAVSWPTGDFWQIGRTRRLQLLASVFRDRLRKSIRENLGASYSPRVSSFGSRTHQDFGYLKTEMVVQPGREKTVIDEVLKISEELRRQGVREDELVRAREPILTALAGTVKTNRYWLNSVLALSSRYPQQLEWAKNIQSDYGAVTADEVSKLAARYLGGKRAAVISVRPGHNKGLLGGGRGLEE